MLGDLIMVNNKHENLYTKCSEFEQAAAAPSLKKDSEEDKLVTMIIQSKLIEWQKTLKILQNGALAETPEQKIEVKKILDKARRHEFPTVEVKSEYGQFSCYVDGERIATGITKRESLVNAVNFF